MSSWQEEYKRKFISPGEAAGLIKSGDKVVFGVGREPPTLAAALAGRKDELTGVRLITPQPYGDYGWYRPGWEKSFNVQLLLINNRVRQLLAERKCDTAVTTIFGGPVVDESIDVLLIELSQPDVHGFCSFGAVLVSKKTQVKTARLVIAEVSNRVIRTYGDNFIHISDIDYFVEHQSTGRTVEKVSVIGKAIPEPGRDIRNIAGHVQSLIRDGDTVQIGIGTVAEGILKCNMFDNMLDLGWHSEATPEEIAQLVRNRVFTGKYKPLHQYKAVATGMAVRKPETVEYVNQNPLFEIYQIEYVDDPRIIAAHDNIIAVNNALAVDLTGQVTAESIGPQLYSVAGGQICFAVGAGLARGGRSVTVLFTTAEEGKVSRIVPVFPQGTIVSVPRTLTDYVITEYGIARLKGKTQRQRAEALIAIAHPDYRAELTAAARKLYWP